MTAREYERQVWQWAAAMDAFDRLLTATPRRDDLILFCVTFPRLAPQMRAAIGERVGAAVMLEWLDERPLVDDRRGVVHDVPDDFGIPETETDLRLKRIIEIAQRWKIGPKEKTIRNRAKQFFGRGDGATDCTENGRYLVSRDEAIAFLQDLKRTTK